jgi:repressor LexA
MKPLTSRQSAILEFVAKYSDRKGFPPTLREIGEGNGLSNVSAVRGHIAALEKKGYITKDADKARSIRIIHSPSALSKLKRQLHEFVRTDKGVLHKVIYGVALVTRKHRDYFVGERKGLIDKALKRRAVEHGWTLLRKQIEPDHIIVIVEVWPNHSPELVVSRIRQSVNRIHLRHIPGKSLWAKGYVATTNLESLDDMLLELLKNTSPTKNNE